MQKHILNYCRHAGYWPFFGEDEIKKVSKGKKKEDKKERWMGGWIAIGEILPLYWPRRSIAVFTRANHRTLPQDAWIQPTSFLFKVHSNLVYPSALKSLKWSLVFQWSVYICNAFLICRVCQVPHASHSLHLQLRCQFIYVSVLFQVSTCTAGTLVAVAVLCLRGDKIVPFVTQL
jgi:hypothetical protein